MRTRTARRLARSVWAASLALGVVAAPLQAVGGLELGDAVFVTIGIVMLLGFSTIGLLIASRQPGNAIGWIFLAVGATWAASGLAQSYAYYAAATALTSSVLAEVADWSGQWNWMPATFLAPTLIALLFPNGHPLSRRWRLAVWAAGGFTAVFVFINAFTPGPLEDPAFLRENPFALGIPEAVVAVASEIGALGMFAVFGASIVSLVRRLRRSRGEERQQMKWLAFALGVAVPIVAAGFLIGGVMSIDSSTLAGNILIAVILAALAFIPIAAGIAILKYRLYEIDVVIRKTVLYGSLAAFLILGFLVLGVLLGRLVGRTQATAVVAAALLGLAFHPVSRLARRFANRVVYGKRATPYEVLSEFSERMAGTFPTEELLPRMARILGEGTGAARADVWLRSGGELRVEASWPSDAPPSQSVTVRDGEDMGIAGHDRVVPVRHQDELLGALTVTKRPGENVTPTEDKLIADFAAQAGLVLRNVRLIEDLRASRKRLVAAQDEERRRIERNIHDGAQQQLVALSVKLRLAHGVAPKDPARADALLQELETQTQSALEDLRDLARGIYPPLLADEGLVAAIQAQARKSPVPVAVEADGIGRYTQEIESAVYFSCLEALQNVTKYAEASRASVRLHHGGSELRFAVEDDGRGFSPDKTSYGTGLQGIADRIDAVGGTLEVRSAPGEGTEVAGQIPTREKST